VVELVPPSPESDDEVSGLRISEGKQVCRAVRTDLMQELLLSKFGHNSCHESPASENEFMFFSISEKVM